MASVPAPPTMIWPSGIPSSLLRGPPNTAEKRFKTHEDDERINWALYDEHKGKDISKLVSRKIDPLSHEELMKLKDTRSLITARKNRITAELARRNRADATAGTARSAPVPSSALSPPPPPAPATFLACLTAAVPRGQKHRRVSQDTPRLAARRKKTKASQATSDSASSAHTCQAQRTQRARRAQNLQTRTPPHVTGAQAQPTTAAANATAADVAATTAALNSLLFQNTAGPQQPLGALRGTAGVPAVNNVDVLRTLALSAAMDMMATGRYPLSNMFAPSGFFGAGGHHVPGYGLLPLAVIPPKAEVPKSDLRNGSLQPALVEAMADDVSEKHIRGDEAPAVGIL